jgi:hypothetical protein
MEPVTGIEPASGAYKTSALPLSYTGTVLSESRESSHSEQVVRVVLDVLSHLASLVDLSASQLAVPLALHPTTTALAAFLTAGFHQCHNKSSLLS